MMRFSRLPLLWRVFAINATLLAIATLLLALTPVTIHASIALVETVDLVVALVVMLAANLLLLRRAIAPIDRLVEGMRTVDLLRPGQRFAVSGGIEVTELTRTFNEMLERLEIERRESGRRVLRAQEAERLRVARGLHDEVGQVLTGVLLQLDSLRNADDAARATDIEETKQSVRQALEEVRRIARELRPEMLEHLGLVSALTELSRRFADQSGITVQRHFDDELPPLSDEAEIAVYRVAQESLTNVARHADARHVDVTLESGAGSVVLRVADDGRGLPEPVPSYNGHTGLRGMRERALLVGGALAIKRSRNGGVEIRLEVPAGGD
jgi:two-component system, NarL family, sensor histidine kinase UhpB